MTTECANCGTGLKGNFCYQCGQREEPRVPTMRSVLGEVGNALFGLESKLWRSLYTLFFKPGELTKEFLAGKRQLYTTPFRLYLLLSVLLFAYLAYLGSNAAVNINQSQTEASLIIDDSTENEQSETKISVTQESPPEQTAQDSEPTEQIISEDVGPVFINTGGWLSKEREDQMAQNMQTSLRQIRDDINAGRAQKVLEHFLEALPKALFIFLPFMALFFKLIFIHKGKYYLEHLVFLLHNHAYIFGTFLLSIALQMLAAKFTVLETPYTIFAILLWFVYTPYYFFRSVREVYATSRLTTWFYGFIIFLGYFIALGIMLAFTAVFSGYMYAA